MVEVREYLGAQLRNAANPLKLTCRLRDLNPRPSVYKTHDPVPIRPYLAGFSETYARSNPLLCRVAGVHRFTVHPRAVVALSTTSKEVG